jgi:predicted PurR-regulated permease PerM
VTRDPMPRWLLALLCLGALVMLAPFAPWIILGVWLGLYAERVFQPMVKVFAGRRGIAATVTVLLFAIVLFPIAGLIGSLVIDAIALVQQLLSSKEGHSILERLARGDTPPGEVTQQALVSKEGVIDLLRAQGGRAWAVFTQVAGLAVHVVVGLLIMVSGMFGVLVEGRSWYSWIEQHAPIPSDALHRFAAAFVETGRGLAWGVVGAGALQAIVATIAYLILGVPSALALGMLTLIFSVIPAIGTAIVWVPVAAGLALTGREGAAIGLAVVGVAVIGSIDNLARPMLTRRGQLQLPTYVTLIAMFGGVELLGGWGLMLGPLIVRLAKEAILIRSEAVANPVVPS